MIQLSREIDFWKFIQQSLRKQGSCVLLVVTKHLDSSPGRSGFKMAINPTGEMKGSIGGGVMEHKLIELAKRWITNDQFSIHLKHQIHRPSAGRNRSGMICSGEQYVAMVGLLEESKAVIDDILFCLKQQKFGVIQLSPRGLMLAKSEVSSKYSFHYKGKSNWTYFEQLNTRFSLHIIGGGHISLALSKLAADLGFEVTVYDHRNNLPTLAENKYAHAVHLNDYHQLNELLPQGDSQFVIIMTVGYRTDMDALQSIIHGDYGYLGVLGSSAKIKHMLVELQKKGFTDELLSKLDAPAGLKIASQTPLEIAVSIAGNLIRQRNELSE